VTIAVLAAAVLLLAILDWLLFWAWLRVRDDHARLLTLEAERRARRNDPPRPLHVVDLRTPPA